jgi:hypothetical protein
MKSGGAVAISIVLLFGVCAPEPAAAQCQQWDLTGKWEFWQSKQKVKVELDLRQNLNTGVLEGKAHMSGKVGAPGGGWMDANFDGPVNGSIKGNTFSFVVRWFQGQRYSGEYRGDMGPQGELKGDTSDVDHPQVTDTWHEWAGRRAKCAAFDPKRDIEVKAPKPFDPKPDIDVLKPGGIKSAPRPGTDLGTGEAKPAPPAQKTATAKVDVDIWDGPGPPDKPYICGDHNCFLRPKDGPQPVLDHHPDGWYKLKTNRAPPGTGWVAEDHLEVH